MLAAGLRLPVVLCYSPRDLASHAGTVELYADDKLQMKVPILRYETERGNFNNKKKS